MTKPLVHLVEDDPVALTFLREVLRTRYRVVTAASCADARAELRRSAPDAVVLDYRLPDGDAPDLIPDYRDAYPDAPIVIASGKSSRGIEDEALRLGAARFLLKPVQPAELLATVAACLIERSRTH